MYTVRFAGAYKKSCNLMRKRGLDVSVLDDVVDTLVAGKGSRRGVSITN